jgi:glycerophosphoryl diester phosphodiesterase
MSRFAFLDHPRPLAVAHRGGSLEAEENTLPAFEHAVRLGYRYVETDVQATRDGVAVVFHDGDLGRMTGRAGRVAQMDWADLARLRTRGGNVIPRLDALLETWPDLRLVLEVKSDAAVAPMAEAIRKAGALHRVCVGSFGSRRTDRLRAALGPDLAWSPAHAGVARVWLGGWGVPLRGPACAALQIPKAWRGVPLATRRTVAAAHACGMQVHVWTVDEAAEMARLLDMGVDGLITDRPSLLRDLMIQRGQWTGR